MSEKPEALPVKKRRVIHWDPEQGRATGAKKWTALRILAWGFGGFMALLIVAGLVIRGIRLVAGPQFLRIAAAPAPGEIDAGSNFVSESKAALARENVAKALAELRRLPQDHPSQLEQLILIEKAFLGGNELLESRNYARAYAHFTALSREIDDFSENVKLKQVTQKAYDEILIRMKDLDRARALAPEEFETAFADAGTGRQFFIDGRFATAKKQFDAAFAALDRAEKALKSSVDKSISTALTAMAAGDKEAAVSSFQAALKLDPSHELAQKGLIRAEVSDRVHALLLQGASLEEKKEYAQARDSFAKAFELDAFSAVSQQGQARNERLRMETEFNEAMTEAKLYREHSVWPKAIAAYERALKVYPKKEEVKKALADAKETSHREAVGKALKQAIDHENNFEWELARSAYNETMELDPKHVEAKEGYIRTGRMIRSIMQYNKLIEVAESYAQHAEFQRAIREFNEAMSIKPLYLPLTDQTSQLRTLLDVQSKPVNVTFNSDGDSWVSISNYRLLGKITSTTLQILPGDYEIVSRRKGFQDVLINLQVRNGTTPPVVNVACTLRANR